MSLAPGARGEREGRWLAERTPPPPCGAEKCSCGDSRCSMGGGGCCWGKMGRKAELERGETSSLRAGFCEGRRGGVPLDEGKAGGEKLCRPPFMKCLLSDGELLEAKTAKCRELSGSHSSGRSAHKFLLCGDGEQDGSGGPSGGSGWTSSEGGRGMWGNSSEGASIDAPPDGRSRQSLAHRRFGLLPSSTRGQLSMFRSSSPSWSGDMMEWGGSSSTQESGWVGSSSEPLGSCGAGARLLFYSSDSAPESEGRGRLELDLEKLRKDFFEKQKLLLAAGMPMWPFSSLSILEKMRARLAPHDQISQRFLEGEHMQGSYSIGDPYPLTHRLAASEMMGLLGEGLQRDAGSSVGGGGRPAHLSSGLREEARGRRPLKLPPLVHIKRGSHRSVQL